jgi:hypothetical protein
LFARALQPLLAESTTDARLEALNRFFGERVPFCPPPDPKIGRAVALITQSKGSSATRNWPAGWT